MIHDYGSGVIGIDTFMHGIEGLTALYHLDGPRPALIESGPGSSIDNISAGLEEAGVDHLDWIILTHIHLDHAGAVGHLAKRFPEARVIVRQEGAPHLVDPSRLWASASRLYPDMERLWGEMLPVDEDRIVAVAEDGVVADLGDGRSIEAHYAPGHAKHQMALLDPSRGDLFTGDAIGVFLPGSPVMRPATPPPDFDLERTIETVEDLRKLNAVRVFPTHFGPIPEPDLAFDEAILRFEQWVEIAKRVFAAGGDTTAIATEFRRQRDDLYRGVPDDLVQKFNNTTSYDLNAAGIFRYLKEGEKTSA